MPSSAELIRYAPATLRRLNRLPRPPTAPSQPPAPPQAATPPQQPRTASTRPAHTPAATPYYIARVCAYACASRACACVDCAGEYTILFNIPVHQHPTQRQPLPPIPANHHAAPRKPSKHQPTATYSTPQQPRGESVPGSALFRRKQSAKFRPRPIAHQRQTAASRARHPEKS